MKSLPGGWTFFSGGPRSGTTGKETMMAQDSFETLVEDFEFLDDWEDRYRMVIELGKAMPPLPTR